MSKAEGMQILYMLSDKGVHAIFSIELYETCKLISVILFVNDSQCGTSRQAQQIVTLFAVAELVFDSISSSTIYAIQLGFSKLHQV